MTEFLAARELAHAAGADAPATTESVPLADAVGRTLAADLAAAAPLPGFASAAMDGWAVRGDGPWTTGAPIRAGDEPALQPLAIGTARPISTGAALPPLTTRVLRTERGTVAGSTLRATAADSGGHRREAGEEAAVGELLLSAGDRLTPPRVALAAVAGRELLDVIAAPSSRLLVLGDEVVAEGAPRPGQVRDAFTPSLPSVLAALGALPPRLARVGDSLPATIEAFGSSRESLLITTGGSARGSADHARATLATLEAELVLDGVRMRPGHPLLLARLPSGALVLCLPGNPLAAYLGLLTIGAALLDGMLRRPLTPLATLPIGVDAVGTASTTRLLTAGRGPEGIVPTSHQGAGMLRGIAQAELVAVIPPQGASTGDEVAVIPLPW